MSRSVTFEAAQALEGVAVTGLTKTYGPHGSIHALSDLSLEFPAGQCTVLLGPSGCGKTTMLRSIAGLVTPDAGRITIGGSVVFDAERRVDMPPEKRRLGMVFQSYALWPHLTIAENIAYPLLGSRLAKPEIARRVDAMLDWVGLGGMGRRFAHELSGGQQQRVSLGRAMVGQPRAVLFDEPLSNLDARLRERMRLDLLALRQETPFTSIYVTHDQLEAMTLGDRVVLMRAGRIEQLGTPEDIYRRPRTRYAADFVGIPNLLEGRIHAVSAAEIAVSTVLGVLRARSWRSDWSVGATCTAAIRANLLALHPAMHTDGRVTGRVLRSVFQGSSNITLLDVAGTQVTAETVGEERHPAGTTLIIEPIVGAMFTLLDD